MRIVNYLVFVLILASYLFSGFFMVKGDAWFMLTIQEVLAAQVWIDTTVNLTAINHSNSSPNTVFISKDNGYTFYVDLDGTCVYRKTTDGGVTWGGPVVVDAQTDCVKVAIWYDQWTPGDSGDLVHIVTTDSGEDDLWYRAFDTSDDTLSGSGPINITSGHGFTATITGIDFISLTKGTDGVLYAMIQEWQDNLLLRCTGTCTTAGNWADDTPSALLRGMDYIILLPQSSGNIMLIWQDTTADQIKFLIRTSSWSSATYIDTVTRNTHSTALAGIGAVINPSNYDVFLTYPADTVTFGTDDDVRVQKYSSGSWSSLTNVVTDSVCAGVADCGVTGARIAYDEDRDFVYVLYSARIVPDNTSTVNQFWKYSTDSGSTWSSELGPVRSVNRPVLAGRLSLMPSRIYATWIDYGSDDLIGRPLAPQTMEQSGYRFFENSNSTDVGDALALANSAATLATEGDAFRLRMLVHIDEADFFANESSFKLQFAEKSGTCDTSFSGESYADVTGGTVIAYNDNASPADGAALTSNVNDPTHSGHTVVNQTYEESNDITPSEADTNLGQDAQFDFSLIDNSASRNTDYCFRLINTDGNTFADLTGSYSVIPQITTAYASTMVVGIVDSSGDPVGSPSISFSAIDLPISYKTVTGTLGTASEKIRVTNETADVQWTLDIAASGGATAVWTGGALYYDYNDPTAGAVDDGNDGGDDTDSYGGQMTIDASTGTLAGTCTDTGISKGSSSSFKEKDPDNIQSINLLIAGGTADLGCYWDFTGISVSQTIPASQGVEEYSLDMTLTVLAI